ncbi:hypothetical protein MHPYR_450007 [uncultured Mycobacterium sp.]|uniref:Uncharacterized protein n=1 Tax=uncultured Mycobacterium sp. TaxID=171292 RepID=A0A1Y5PFV7_9MYCO|nr:hypothetical protein MHPYR_450007 [uncultured Mycobacterium sp.]
MTNVSGPPIDAQITRLTREALRLARFTIAYNIAEGVIAVSAGLVAGRNPGRPAAVRTPAPRCG